MDFKEMYKRIRNGEKARRSCWKTGEYVCWIPQMIVHNTPYHPIDIPVLLGINPMYKYVVERDDPIAQDWEVVS